MVELAVMAPDGKERPKADPAERQRRIRSRNLAVLAVLLALVALFYALTIVRLGGAGGG